MSILLVTEVTAATFKATSKERRLGCGARLVGPSTGLQLCPSQWPSDASTQGCQQLAIIPGGGGGGALKWPTWRLQVLACRNAAAAAHSV